MASLIKTETVQHHHQQDHRRGKKQHIIVKEHPSIPCAIFYEDIFSTIIVECKDEEHNQLLSLNKNGQGGTTTPDLVDDGPDSTVITTTAPGVACYNDNQFRYT
jgi:hypothetical protein